MYFGSKQTNILITPYGVRAKFLARFFFPLNPIIQSVIVPISHSHLRTPITSLGHFSVTDGSEVYLFF